MTNHNKHCKHRIRKIYKANRHQCISGICIWERKKCVICGDIECVPNRPYIKEPRSNDYDASRTETASQTNDDHKSSTLCTSLCISHSSTQCEL